VLLGTAGLSVLAFVAAAVLRLSFPYPLEITEGASLAEIRRILQGQPLYAEPSLEHVSMIYGPVYYYVAALVALVIGPSFLSLRLVSLVASLGSVALVGLIVHRETGNRTGAIVAAGVFAASYPLADGALDLGRVDALMLALLLGSMYFSRAPGSRSAAVAGVLMALALLTKQAAAPIALLTLVYFIATSRRRAGWYAAALALTLVVPLAIVELQSSRWATLFLVQLPRQHMIDELRMDQFWRLSVLPYFTLALAAGLLFLTFRLQAKDRQAGLFYVLAAVGMLGIAWASDSNQGASNNVLLPAFAILSILTGLGLAEALRQLQQLTDGRGPYYAFAVSIAILQLLLLIYNPRDMVPYRSDLWADDRLASTLASLPGSLFAPDFDAFVGQRADGPPQPYLGSVAELLGGYGGHAVPEGDAWVQTLRDRLSRREYDYVVVDPESQWFFVSGALRDANYADAGPLFPPDDDFWRWGGGTAPRSEVYVPRERLGQSVTSP
jgi:4-amino-4-deoxy-L-arabinose transferase-like glycosyltransferase